MDLIITTLAIAMLIIILQELVSNVKRKKLPPGPRGLPIFGSLHLLGKFPHRSLHKLAEKYGSVMSLRLGSVQAIVVSSPEAAESVLKTHDLNFASRPPHEASRYISYNQKNITFSQYGPYWRNVRKMCTLELLSSTKISSFRLMRKEEVGLLVQYLKEASSQRLTVDISAKIFSLSADMSCRMVVGKKYMDKEFDEQGFKAVFQEALQLAVLPNLGEYIPWIAPLDLQGLTKRMKAVAKVFDAFLEKIIDEHMESKDRNETKDFVNVMLTFMGSKEAEYGIERDNVKAIVLDMLGGSMDTSAGVVDWALAELLKHPRVMKKVQKELEEKIGMNRMVEESDLESLEYLDMVIKETLRLHPVAPLLVPHVAVEDCTINGFLIPRNSRVFINNWALGRNPTVWNEADKFFPERFIGNSIDIRGRDFQLLPFGSGRRGCPGMQLGITVVRLVVAQLMHCFDWELPGDMLPTDLDMTEEFSLVMNRSKNLHVVPTYRLNL